jgi:hypothetical protein
MAPERVQITLGCAARNGCRDGRTFRWSGKRSIRHRYKGFTMTYAIYAILTAMTIIFFVSFYWYRQSVRCAEEARWFRDNHVIDRLRGKPSL